MEKLEWFAAACARFGSTQACEIFSFPPTRMTAGTEGTTTSTSRVIHVSLSLEMGGMEKLLVEFARHADRHRTTVARPHDMLMAWRIE